MEKGLMPQMSAPVERKLFEASALGESGAERSVVPSRRPVNWGNERRPNPDTWVPSGPSQGPTAQAQACMSNCFNRWGHIGGDWPTYLECMKGCR